MEGSFRFCSRITIDIGSFHAKYKDSEFTHDDSAQVNASMVKMTESMLANNSQYHLSLLRVCFYLLKESLDNVRCVDNAMASREIAALHFMMFPEIVDLDCTPDHKMNYGRRFMRFFDAGPRAFGCLCYLHIQCVALSINDMANVLEKCNKLLHLSLKFCDFGFESVLKMEHTQLTILEHSYCKCASVQLICLPSLVQLTCDVWTAPEDEHPISFDYVPQLSTLILCNLATTYHKKIQLSEFLINVMISELDLDFSCERVSHDDALAEICLFAFYKVLYV